MHRSAVRYRCRPMSAPRCCFVQRRFKFHPWAQMCVFGVRTRSLGTKTSKGFIRWRTQVPRIALAEQAGLDCWLLAPQRTGIRGWNMCIDRSESYRSFTLLLTVWKGYRYLDTNCCCYPFDPSGVFISSRNDGKVSSDEVETSADCVLLLDSARWSSWLSGHYVSSIVHSKVYKVLISLRSLSQLQSSILSFIPFTHPLH